MKLNNGNIVIFKALVGSHSYGTNVEGSDIDYKGVYIQSPEDVLENGYRQQFEVSKDETYYELRRFIELCCTNNPTMIELLYTPEDCIVYKHPVFDQLIKERDKILSKSARWSFGGYAISQIEKADGLEKKMNWEVERTERKTVLDFCWVLHPGVVGGTMPLKEFLISEGLKQENLGLAAVDHFRYTYTIYETEEGSTERLKGIVQDEETSNDVSLSDVPKNSLPVNILYFNKDGYSKHCKEYKSYQDWLKNRNTQRYVDVENHGQRIDGKNLMHCVRLLEVANEIATKGIITVKRPNAEYLKDIRKGKYDLSTILDNCKEMVKGLDKAFDESSLPDNTDRGYFMRIINRMRKDLRNEHVQYSGTTTSVE